jgi:hypothetical protein
MTPADAGEEAKMQWFKELPFQFSSEHVNIF